MRPPLRELTSSSNKLSKYAPPSDLTKKGIHESPPAHWLDGNAQNIRKCPHQFQGILDFRINSNIATDSVGASACNHIPGDN